MRVHQDSKWWHQASDRSRKPRVLGSATISKHSSQFRELHHYCRYWLDHVNFEDNAAQVYCQKTSSLSMFWSVSWSQEPSAICAHNFRLCMLAGAYSMDKHPVLKSWTGRRDGVGREKEEGEKESERRERKRDITGVQVQPSKAQHRQWTVTHFLQLGSAHFFQVGHTHFLQLGPTHEVSLAYLIMPPSRDWAFN